MCTDKKLFYYYGHTHATHASSVGEGMYICSRIKSSKAAVCMEIQLGRLQSGATKPAAAPALQATNQLQRTLLNVTMIRAKWRRRLSEDVAGFRMQLSRITCFSHTTASLLFCPVFAGRFSIITNPIHVMGM